MSQLLALLVLTIAMKWLRILFGRYPTNGSLCSFLSSVGVSRRFMKGSWTKLEEGLSIFIVAVLLLEEGEVVGEGVV